MKTPSRSSLGWATSLPLALGLSLTAGCPATPDSKSDPNSKGTAKAVKGSTGSPATKVERPATKKVAVKDTYHGVEVSEDYRWLEDGKAAEVKAWSDAQNKYARQHLDRLEGRAKIQARVSEVLKAKAVSFYGLTRLPSGFLALEREPPKQQPFLVRLDGPDAPESAKVVLDPNVLDKKGTTHIDWFVPSHDGKLVAVSLSKGGTESGDVHVYEIATGKQVHEVIPRVNGGTAGGDLAWAPDDKGFFYTRYPRGDERSEADRDFYQQLYFHQLGTPTEKDRYEMGKSLPRIAEIQVSLHKKTGRILATVQKGDGGEFELHLRTKKGEWKKFSEFGDRILAGTFGAKDDLYLLSRAGAPRGKILQLPIANLDASKAKVVVPEGEDTIVEDFWGPGSIRVTESRMYVLYQLGGPSELRAFSLDGKPAKGPKAPPVSAVSSMMGAGGDDLIFRHTSYLEPPAYYRYDAKTDTTTKTKLAKTASIDTANFTTVREMATSKDGTSVPVNIIHKKGLEKNGKHACVVYGYGGYGVNIVPSYRTRDLMFAERGVVYAVANIRGGGEFGEEWHRQGNLTNKQNVFDDFAAAVKHMVSNQYCDAKRVGILGGSNGGLLMGATMVQHPELARVVVSYVGIYDMLRVELSPNGAFNIPEFGTVKNPDHFKAMYAYSPYHNVKDGTAYPPVLFITGENDPRVDPMQSRKMTARLQAATGGKASVLLRTTKDAGHGGGAGLDERIAQYVDMYAFYFSELGVNPDS